MNNKGNHSGLRFTSFKSALGWVALQASPAGIMKLTLPQPTEQAALAELGVSAGAVGVDKDRFSDLIARLQDYFKGKSVDFPEDLDLSVGTAFQQKVWRSCYSIPYGQTRSYGWIARQIGNPRATRAVGQALGRNPIPIIIPCHRVLAAGSKLGGFSGGLSVKEQLLALERVEY